MQCSPSWGLLPRPTLPGGGRALGALQTPFPQQGSLPGTQAAGQGWLGLCGEGVPQWYWTRTLELDPLGVSPTSPVN